MSRALSLYVSRLLIGAALPAILFVASPRMASAQTGAAIEGTVKDDQGGVLPGASLNVRNQDTGFERTSVTGTDGRYRFAALVPGRYTLKAELQGFASEQVRDIELTIGLELRRDFVLKLQTLAETITVTGEAPVVDTTKSEVAGVVTQAQIQSLPVNSRQYLNLALLMPGTSQDASRPFYNNVAIGAGGSFYSNAFLVDNVTNTWAEQGEPRQNFPQEAVREFKVNTMQYKAEYGLATGGLLTVVTKSGTNELHGSLFEYFRDKSLNAQRLFETTKPDYRRNQFGGSLGGPILQNRWQYFGAFERTRTDEFFTVNTGKPQFYSAVEGTFAKPSHTNLYTLRSDMQVMPTQSLFVRYAQEDEKRTCFTCGGNNSANSGYDQAIPRRAVVIGHTWTQSSNLLNDLRFQFAFAEYQIAPAGTNIATWGDNSPARYARIQRVFQFPSLTYGGSFDDLGPEKRWQIKDEYTIAHGSHNIKSGVDFSFLTFKEDSFFGDLNGRYTFGTDQYFNPSDPTSIANLKGPILYTQQDKPVQDTSVPTKNLALFVQDDWKPGSRLSVSLGLRYDSQFGSFNENLNLAKFPRPLPFADPSIRGDRNNFGPRLGFVYDAAGNGKSVWRGGYGIYYDNIRTLANFGEWRNFQVLTIRVANPPYPDPFLGQDPKQFISNAPPNVSVLANNFVNPWSQQYNLGFTQEMRGDYALSVDGVYTRVQADRKLYDLNLADPVTGLRPNPTFGRIDQDQSVSDSKYRALYVRLNKRQSHNYQFLLSYTLAKAEDNNPAARWVNQVRQQDDWGTSTVDRRHTVVASGAVLLPYDIQFGAVWTARSALPFNTIAGLDLNRDGFATDYVPGTTRNQGNRDLDLSLVNAWRAQRGLSPIPASQIDSSRFNSIDVRASKQVPLSSGWKAEVIVQVFNVLNTKNLLAPFTSPQVTNALSDSFGRILTAQPGTQAELAVRLVW
jgi:Carboxypeptidase regulatory-like domain/TonB dependent receptor